jgi:ribosomal protein S18 acetylase RimI-like enzyme
MQIRAATSDDTDAIWQILEARIRAGETYPLPLDLTREHALADWFERGHDVFVAVDDDRVLGTYYLRANQPGGGSHIANCGYMTAASTEHRGVGRAMCLHSLAEAKRRGFRAMQFNFVVSTNERAVKLWQACGFEIVGRLPGAFKHPVHGYVDALVMFQRLT